MCDSDKPRLVPQGKAQGALLNEKVPQQEGAILQQYSFRVLWGKSVYMYVCMCVSVYICVCSLCVCACIHESVFVSVFAYVGSMNTHKCVVLIVHKRRLCMCLCALCISLFECVLVCICCDG